MSVPVSYTHLDVYKRQVDDVVKFVKREIRRGNKYDGIIMDPPSYGRGPSGEVWKIENELYPLVEDLSLIHISQIFSCIFIVVRHKYVEHMRSPPSILFVCN